VIRDRQRRVQPVINVGVDREGGDGNRNHFNDLTFRSRRLKLSM
jgi:hypothetical protein